MDGEEITWASLDGMVSIGQRFERSLDCAAEPSIDAATCARFQCLLSRSERFFVGRYVDRPIEEQLHPDGLWLRMDRPWPATNACREDAELAAFFAGLEPCP